jgi:hypothetical protein
VRSQAPNGQAPGAALPALSPRSRWVLVAVALVLALAVWGVLWSCGSLHPTPRPPEVDLREIDPEVAGAIQEARAAVVRQPGAARAWGNLARRLHAYNFLPRRWCAMRRESGLTPATRIGPIFVPSSCCTARRQAKPSPSCGGRSSVPATVRCPGSCSLKPSWRKGRSRRPWSNSAPFSPSMAVTRAPAFGSPRSLPPGGIGPTACTTWRQPTTTPRPANGRAPCASVLPRRPASREPGGNVDRLLAVRPGTLIRAPAAAEAPAVQKEQGK